MNDRETSARIPDSDIMFCIYYFPLKIVGNNVESQTLF